MWSGWLTRCGNALAFSGCTVGLPVQHPAPDVSSSPRDRADYTPLCLGASNTVERGGFAVDGLSALDLVRAVREPPLRYGPVGGPSSTSAADAPPGRLYRQRPQSRLNAKARRTRRTPQSLLPVARQLICRGRVVHCEGYPRHGRGRAWSALGRGKRRPYDTGCRP